MNRQNKSHYLASLVLLAQSRIPLGGIEGVGGFTDIEGEAGVGPALENLISTLLGALTAVAGVAFILYFVLGAVNWITAGGDQAKVDSARKQITNAIMGLVIVVVAYFIISVVGTLLGFDILNPAATLGL